MMLPHELSSDDKLYVIKGMRALRVVEEDGVNFILDDNIQMPGCRVLFGIKYDSATYVSRRILTDGDRYAGGGFFYVMGEGLIGFKTMEVRVAPKREQVQELIRRYLDGDDVDRAIL